MFNINRRTSSLTLGVSLLWSVATGCSDGDFRADGANGSLTPVEDGTDQALDSVSVELEQQIAHATQFGDSEVQVDIFALDGTPQFSVVLRLGEAEEENVLWTLHQGYVDASGTEESASGALAAPFEQLPSLEEGVRVAGVLQKQIASASLGDEYDNHGCDLPFPTISSCGPWGVCCDIHDACYARFNCRASSWINPFASNACKGCNAAFLLCAAGPIKFPSACCFNGNCGRPR